MNSDTQHLLSSLIAYRRSTCVSGCGQAVALCDCAGSQDLLYITLHDAASRQKETTSERKVTVLTTGIRIINAFADDGYTTTLTYTTHTCCVTALPQL